MIAETACRAHHRRKERAERGRSRDGAGVGRILARRLDRERSAIFLRRSRHFDVNDVPVEQTAPKQYFYRCCNKQGFIHNKEEYLRTSPRIGNDAAVDTVES